MLRRDLLVRAGLAMGATALSTPGLRAVVRATSELSPTPLDDWESVRAQFDLAPGLVQMSGFFLASHPRPVRAAIDTLRRAIDANPYSFVNDNEERMEEASARAAAAYMGVDPNGVALTESTTMGLGLLYGGLTLRPGQEILTTTHDHYSTETSLRLRAERTGAVVRRVSLYAVPERATEGEIVGALERAITPRTRVVAVTWVHSSTGVRLPIRAMAQAIARANAGRAPDDRALLCVDGVHGFGCSDERVADLGCDFFVSGCHKWMFGPRGTGVVWGTENAWAVANPTIPSFDMQNYLMWMEVVPRAPRPRSVLFSPGGFHAFEHRWALPSAFAMHRDIGPARIAGRIRDLNAQLKEGLASMRHVTLHTPRSAALSAGITTFEVNGVPVDQTVARLTQRGIVASVTPYKTLYARLAPGLLNNEAEVDRTLAEVRALGPLAGGK